MSLCGTLQDLPLADLLQMIAANRKTGRLVLTRRDGHGVVAFRNGKIIYAASNSVRETLGNILLHERLITESTLLEALERQSRAAEEKRLGHVLVEMGALDEAQDRFLPSVEGQAWKSASGFVLSCAEGPFGRIFR